ncbi:MAG TPA: Wzz/FepE/Etk N-terminal domain-containing protein [Solirubrobacteraceae bacterium]|nr:Wzz/FepE/Etk N-terminal domain-containing protein [Solirubrobacteraceae bacterium]
MYLDSTPRQSSRAGGRAEPRPFTRYWRTIVEHWRVVVFCVAVAVVGAGAYVATAHKQYSAQAQMLVAPVPTTNSTLLTLPVVHQSSDPTRDMATAASLITNQQVAARVVSALHLRESPNDLMSNMSAAAIGNSDLVGVTATAPTAAQAQAIANEWVRQVVATRAAALQAAVATRLPGVQAQTKGLPASQQSGPGTIADQYAQLQQLEHANDPSITLAALADRPASPSSPQTKLALVAAVLGGLVLGIIAAFAFDALDPRLRREEQAREIFNVPVLARIPRQRRIKGRRPILPQELTFSGAEGYRTLRTILSARAEGETRAILVTGSAPAEGKTTSAINLAAALAQGRSGVILVEADLRRPSIAQALELDVQYGIDDVMAGEADVGEALTVANLGKTSIGVLALRQPGDDLADMLSLAVAESLIRQVKALSDFVVIDSPPLTAVSDALPLAKLADDVLVVARQGSSKLSKLWELRDILVEQGTFPTGIVLVGQSAPRSTPYYSRGDRSQPPRGQHQEHGQRDPVA